MARLEIGCLSQFVVAAGCDFEHSAQGLDDGPMSVRLNQPADFGGPCRHSIAWTLSSSWATGLMLATVRKKSCELHCTNSRKLIDLIPSCPCHDFATTHDARRRENLRPYCPNCTC